MKVSLPTPRLVVVALVKRPFVAKRFVEVAFVEVEIIVESAVMLEEALAMRPPLKLRSVEVAFEGKR